MVFATKVLVLAIFYRLPCLLEDSLWWWVIRWSKHSGLLLSGWRTIKYLLIRRRRLLSTIVMHHWAAEGWTI